LPKINTFQIKQIHIKINYTVEEFSFYVYVSNFQEKEKFFLEYKKIISLFKIKYIIRMIDEKFKN